MLTRLDRTIAELEEMVTKHQILPECEPETVQCPGFANLVFLLPHDEGAAGQSLLFDDVWITVCAPDTDREALTSAGFAITPRLNRHQGWATEYAIAEFQNSFLELMWWDTASSGATGVHQAVEKFPDQDVWPSKGWRPVSMTGQVTEISQAGPEIRLRSQRVGISALAVNPNLGGNDTPGRPPRFAHPLGVRRVTAVRLVAPSTYGPVGPVEYLRTPTMLGLRTGMGWAVEVTFDSEAKHKTRDLRPRLPLVVKY
jgi:hypothetical protein